MSAESESEDDFLSADEGSEEESEDLNEKQGLSKSQSPQPINHDDYVEKAKENIACTDRDLIDKTLLEQEKSEVTKEGSLIDALDNLSLQVNKQLDVPKDTKDSLDSDSENDSEISDVEPFDPESKFKTFSESLALSKEVSKQTDASDISKEVSKQTEACDISKEESKQTDTSDEEIDIIELESSKSISHSSKLEKESKLLDNESALNLDKEKCDDKINSLNHLESDEIDLKEKKEFSLIDKPINKTLNLVSESKLQNECSVETPINKDISEKNDSVTDGNADIEKKVSDERTTETINIKQKQKPIKESKIGMKKPREKLGERLGAKKLGGRIEKKSLESISSESVCKSSDAGSLQDQNKATKMEEKKKQDNLRGLEEDRWRQVQGEDNKTKQGSNRNNERETDWGSPWGNWGSTLINAASTLTTEVSRGVGTIMETVEGTLGAPDPETLAKEMVEKEKLLIMESEKQMSANTAEDKPPNYESVHSEGITRNRINPDVNNSGSYSVGGLSSIGSLVSGVSGVFETASNTVLLGGLDTLEVIGRKTMDVIQDGDPGLRKKRSILINNKPNLSAMLQEARQQTEEQELTCQERGRKDSYSNKPTLDQAWEATEGPVHFEALSLVAKQCESKNSSMMQNMPHGLVDKIKAANSEISDLCELEEETSLEDFVLRVKETVPQIGLPTYGDRIIQAWYSLESAASMLKEIDVIDGPTAEKELYTAVAGLLEQLAALLHKGAELSLITPETDPIDTAAHFKELCSSLCSGIESIAEDACNTITKQGSASKAQIADTTTNIFYQFGNGNTYLQQGLSYVSLVLQYANTKEMSSNY